MNRLYPDFEEHINKQKYDNKVEKSIEIDNIFTKADINSSQLYPELWNEILRMRTMLQLKEASETLITKYDIDSFIGGDGNLAYSL